MNNLKTNNVESMSNMFTGCSSLTSLNLSNFDTSKVTNMSNMFQWCSSLTNLDLRSFNTSKVTTMLAMFAGCENLKEIKVSSSKWIIGNGTNTFLMFEQCGVQGVTEY